MSALGRRRYVDRFDFAVAEQLPVIGAGARGFEFFVQFVKALAARLGEVQALHQRMLRQRLGADAAAPAGPYYGNTDLSHGFTLMLASLMSLAYLSISDLMKAANCSGVLLTATTPKSANFFFTSGSASAFTVSAWSFCTIGRGVPAGKSTPHQFTATSPGAASRHGGCSGRSSNFSAPVMHSARSFPARTCCIAGSVSEKMKLICPPRRSCTASTPPL